MRVTTRYFALVREITTVPEEHWDLPEGSPVDALVEEIVARYPRVERLRASSLVMVNQQYVQSNHQLSDGDEVALIPPVSGGEGYFEITEDRVSLDAVIAAVRTEQAGAVVTFLGTVRSEARGKTVRFLEYEAYTPAALRVLEQIASEARARWAIERLAMIHRVGRVEIGEASVAIAVSAAHRADAFAACRFLIDRTKESVPIWKKEYYSEGEVWIGSEAAYQADTHDPAQG